MKPLPIECTCQECSALRDVYVSVAESRGERNAMTHTIGMLAEKIAQDKHCDKLLPRVHALLDEMVADVQLRIAARKEKPRNDAADALAYGLHAMAGKQFAEKRKSVWDKLIEDLVSHGFSIHRIDPKDTN